MKITLTCLAAVLALTLTACGGGGDDEAKDAIATSLVEQGAGAQGMPTMQQDEADCIADGMVDGIGTDQLEEYGIIDENGAVQDSLTQVKMSEEDAETTVDAMFDCTDAMAMLRDQMTKSLGDVDAATKACVEDAFGEDVVRQFLVASFTGNQDDAAGAEMMQPLMKCMGVPQS